MLFAGLHFGLHCKLKTSDKQTKTKHLEMYKHKKSQTQLLDSDSFSGESG